MQERRILNCLIDLSKIPSTAVQVTANNYTTVQGNVIYIPLNEVTNSESQISITIKPKTSNTTYLDSIDGVNFTTNYYYLYNNGSTLYLPKYLGDSSGTYYMGRFSTSSDWIKIGSVSVHGNTDFMHGTRYPDDAIYYSKIKFKANILISSGSNYLNTYTIYIDTEN